MLTGQYPSRHGAWSIGCDTPDDALSLPARLRRDAGYKTALIGKSHYKNCLAAGSFEALPHVRDWEYFSRWTGPWFGFEYAKIAVGHVCEPHAYSMHYGLFLHEQGLPPIPPYFGPGGDPAFDEVNDPEWKLPLELHPSVWAANETIDYLRARRDDQQPFYVSLNLPDPHCPFLAPAPYHRMYDGVDLPSPVRRQGEAEGKPTIFAACAENREDRLGWHDRFKPMCQGAIHPSMERPVERTREEDRFARTYLGMTTLLDDQVGRVLVALDELGLAENTIVVFTSDHGEHLGDHWLWGKGPSHYDACVRVPFIVRWPGRIAAGRRSRALQSLVDLPPTFLSAAGLPIPKAMQGTDQRSTWTGAGAAARDGVWIDQRMERGAAVHTWITARHRLSIHHIHAENRTETELYDFENDPNEFENLANSPQSASLVSALSAEMARYQDRISGPWSERHAMA